jgi:D-lactate dehydrogenase
LITIGKYIGYYNAKIATYVDYKDTIEEAVEGADIVTLHVPATKYNQNGSYATTSL